MRSAAQERLLVWPRSLGTAAIEQLEHQEYGVEKSTGTNRHVKKRLLNRKSVRRPQRRVGHRCEDERQVDGCR